MLAANFCLISLCWVILTFVSGFLLLTIYKLCSFLTSFNSRFLLAAASQQLRSNFAASKLPFLYIRIASLYSQQLSLESQDVFLPASSTSLTRRRHLLPDSSRSDRRLLRQQLLGPGLAPRDKQFAPCHMPRQRWDYAPLGSRSEQLLWQQQW